MEAIFDAIGSIGIWAVIVGVILYLVIEKFKAKKERDTKQDANNQEARLKEIENNRDERTLELIKDMQKEFCETIVKQINNVGLHTVEDEEKNCKINEYIDDALECLLEKTNSHRAFLVSYHNGEKSIDGRGYQKMSITNERTVSWVSPIMDKCQNMQRTMLSSIYKTLIKQDRYYIENIEVFKDDDPVAYGFLKEHGVRSTFIHSLKREDGLVTGFVAIEYVSDVNFNEETISRYLEKKALKITGALLGENSDLINRGANSNE